jgi:hypothetical protein
MGRYISPSLKETFVYEQLVPSTEWAINHYLGCYPSVTIIDSADSVLIGDITYISEDTLKVNFTFAFAGKALLN